MQEFFESYGLIGLFLCCFLAATILPLSSELVVVAFVLNGAFPSTIVLIVASIGNILGGLTNLLLGRMGSRLLPPKSKGKLWIYAQKYGAWSALFSWLPFVGDPLLIILGYLKAPWMPSIILMSLGKVARYAFLIYLL